MNPVDLSLLNERAMTEFVHIPGPNPILKPGELGAWDDGVIEACDVLKDEHTYYLYYHGTSQRGGYQLGVATARHPLGPFVKHETAMLEVGPEGSWDDRSVACAFVVKEGADRFLMWYSGMANVDNPRWDIGLATASSPLGPWEKHPANPILKDFGYVGGVVRVEGQYWLYTEHPIGSTGPDYGPMSLAIADHPEGPWVPFGPPVLRQGGWGEWDDGGFSEAEVFFRSGLFHMFYGAAKLHPTRLDSQESIGYAYSLDGLNFVKHPGNPVAPREANPDAAAFAEVHSLVEPPFVYLYHTLRYESRPGIEHLGVQVLAIQRPFVLTMPVLQVESLQEGEQTTLDACPPLCVGKTEGWSLTVEGCGGDDGVLQVRVLTSVNGVSYDTQPVQVLEVQCREGCCVRKTYQIRTIAAFAKVIVHNVSPEYTVREIAVWATLKG